jgi:hypothetical protein
MTYKIAPFPIPPHAMAAFGWSTPSSGEGRWQPTLLDKHGAGSSGQRLVLLERCPGGLFGDEAQRIIRDWCHIGGHGQASLVGLEAEGAKPSSPGSQVLLLLSDVKGLEMCFRLHQGSSERPWDVL